MIAGNHHVNHERDANSKLRTRTWNTERGTWNIRSRGVNIRGSMRARVTPSSIDILRASLPSCFRRPPLPPEAFFYAFRFPLSAVRTQRDSFRSASHRRCAL